MHDFVKSAFLKAGFDDDQAQIMAQTLVAGDLRGVFSHGSQLTTGYVSRFLDGELNPRPQIRVVRESPTSVKVNGDGGLVYLPSFTAMEMAD